MKVMCVDLHNMSYWYDSFTEGKEYRVIKRTGMKNGFGEELVLLDNKGNRIRMWTKDKDGIWFEEV